MSKWKFPPESSKPDSRIQHYENLVSVWKDKSNDQAAEIERLKAGIILSDELHSTTKQNYKALELANKHQAEFIDQREATLTKLRARVEELEARKSGHLAESQRLLVERDELRTQAKGLEYDLRQAVESDLQHRTQLEAAQAKCKNVESDFRERLAELQAKLAAHKPKAPTLDEAINVLLGRDWEVVLRSPPTKIGKPV